MKSLLIKNNNNETSGLEEEHNVVYQYTCDNVGCSTDLNQYIGYTTNTLKTRMMQHYYKGAIRTHHQ